MELNGRIMQIAHEFEGRSGKRPLYLYLGHDEAVELKAAVWGWMHYSVIQKPDEEVARCYYSGMRLFRVNAKSHIGVS